MTEIESTRTSDVELTMVLVKLLMESAEAIEDVVSQVLTDFDVSPSVGGVLWALATRAEPPTMRDMAEGLGCDPSTISLIADKLESGDLVSRQPHPRDGRKRVLVLTPRGQELWMALSTRLDETTSLAGLSADDRRQLVALLAKITP